jgi:hypothetical protein
MTIESPFVTGFTLSVDQGAILTAQRHARVKGKEI